MAFWCCKSGKKRDVQEEAPLVVGRRKGRRQKAASLTEGLELSDKEVAELLKVDAKTGKG